MWGYPTLLISWFINLNGSNIRHLNYSVWSVSGVAKGVYWVRTHPPSKIRCLFLLQYSLIEPMLPNLPMSIDKLDTAWKVSKYRVFSGPCFPVFGLNLRIQSEYRKIRTRKKSVFGPFSHSESFWRKSFDYEQWNFRKNGTRNPQSLKVLYFSIVSAIKKLMSIGPMPKRNYNSKWCNFQLPGMFVVLYFFSYTYQFWPTNYVFSVCPLLTN